MVEQALSAHQGAGGRRSVPQQLDAAFIDRERPAFATLGTVTVPASYQPDSSAIPSCGSAMNPSSDIVMCETTLPIRYLLPVACMMMNVTDGQSSSVEVSEVVDGILFPESSPTSPARSSTLMAARSQVTDGTCTGLVTRGFCRL